MIDAAALRAYLQRWCAAITASAPELNTLDGQLGDGDLGATLEKCAANISSSLPAETATLSDIFRAAAQASARASGSSFGTLLSIALLTASKSTAGASTLSRAQTASLLDQIVVALSSRGGASIGDKTMLDSLHAIAAALAAAPDNADLKSIAHQAAQNALDEFRALPNKIGRARMFTEKSIGLDDPGMVAISRMTAAL